MVSPQEIEQAAGIIRRGGLVAFPTETVYGLGANALDPIAVAKIFACKERPSFDPLIVHIASMDQLRQLTRLPDERVAQLARVFWPGPLTIVLPKSEQVPDIVTSGLDTVGIRMPDHPVALALISASGCPIAAPSANKFGKLSPTKAEHVRKQLHLVDHVLDGGPTRVGIESTVIALHDDGFVVLRQGIITAEELEKVVSRSTSDSTREEQIASPGHIQSHYSPNKPLYIWREYADIPDTRNAAFLSAGSPAPAAFKRVEYLSESGNLYEIAANLFQKMHALEEDGHIEFIVAEPVQEAGIGLAIMDRLRKAAFQYR